MIPSSIKIPKRGQIYYLVFRAMYAAEDRPIAAKMHSNPGTEYGAVILAAFAVIFAGRAFGSPLIPRLPSATIKTDNRMKIARSIIMNAFFIILLQLFSN